MRRRNLGLLCVKTGSYNRASVIIVTLFICLVFGCSYHGNEPPNQVCNVASWLLDSGSVGNALGDSIAAGNWELPLTSLSLLLRLVYEHIEWLYVFMMLGQSYLSTCGVLCSHATMVDSLITVPGDCSFGTLHYLVRMLDECTLMLVMSNLPNEA